MPFAFPRFAITATLVAATLALSACGSRPARYIEPKGALGPYSAAVRNGDVWYVAGKIGAKRDGSFADEAESAIDAVETQLDALGLGLSDVLVATVYLVDMNRYAEFNAIYGRRFSRPYPARACVAVAALPAGARVEIMVTARARD